MLHKYCQKLSGSMTGYIDCQDKQEWLTYGLELIIGELSKFGMIVGIACWIGILPVTLLILASALPYRVITGGGHSSTYLRCTVITLSVYLLLSMFARWLIVIVDPGLILAIYPVVVVIAFCSAQIWVPGIEQNFNFQAEINQKKYKNLAKIYLTIWLFSCLLVFTFSDNYKVYFVCTMVGITWQTFFVTPAGYSFLGYTEKVSDILGKKEV